MPWRGGPTVSASNDFADLNRGDWYADAVSWATANGVVSGMGKGMFGPNAPLTREQLALILYHYAQVAEYVPHQGSMAVQKFSDSASISGWALEAVQWAVNAGLISGTGGGMLDPDGTATRAQVAQIFMNFLGMQFRMDMNVYVPSAQSVLTRLDYQYASPFISFALTGGDSSV